MLLNVKDIIPSRTAFAAITRDGAVVPWGYVAGGSGSLMEWNIPPLESEVENIYAGDGGAFVLVLKNGAAVTIGNYSYGGSDYGQLRPEYEKGNRVQTVVHTNKALAALMTNGRVLTWGDVNSGGYSIDIQELKQGVDQIYSTNKAFAAKIDDGSVVTWGDVSHGGNSRAVEEDLKQGVDTIYSNLSAFAAVDINGRVVTWGNMACGGDSSAVQAELKQGVDTIYSTFSAFAAIKRDGSVVTWGDADSGGDSSAVQAELKQGVIKTIHSTGFAFAALKKDGSVVTWGLGSRLFGGYNFGTYSSEVQEQLKQGVETIVSSDRAFAAKMDDGSVVTWGDPEYGGDSRAVQEDLKRGVVSIYSTDSAFAALKTDGSVVTWGDAKGGGDSSAVQSELEKYASGYRKMLRYVGYVLDTKLPSEIIDQIKEEYLEEKIRIYSTCQAFAALLPNGRVVTWGSRQYGGNSSRVQPPLTAPGDPGHGGREPQVTFKKAPPDDTLVKINDKIGRLRRLNIKHKRKIYYIDADPTTVVTLNKIKRVKVE